MLNWLLRVPNLGGLRLTRTGVRIFASYNPPACSWAEEFDPSSQVQRWSGITTGQEFGITRMNLLTKNARSEPDWNRDWNCFSATSLCVNCFSLKEEGDFYFPSFHHCLLQRSTSHMCRTGAQALYNVIFNVKNAMRSVLSVRLSGLFLIWRNVNAIGDVCAPLRIFLFYIYVIRFALADVI